MARVILESALLPASPLLSSSVQAVSASQAFASVSVARPKHAPRCTRCDAKSQSESETVCTEPGLGVSRRTALAALSLSSGWIAANGGGGQRENAWAVIPTTAVAGRIPGLSDPDENGFRLYKRPLGKSGGHGVGWSELIPYSFKVPDSWEEVPVSIADLGGTEIDLRFLSSQQGALSVVVAPVLRFSDSLGDDARVENIGPPEKVISAFGPEVTGESVEGKVEDMKVVEHDGRKYYLFELDPHILINITAAGNRLYILTVKASGRQWKKYANNIKAIVESFRVG